PAPHDRQGRAEQQYCRAGQHRELPRLAQRPGEQDGRAQDRPDRGRSRAVQERLRDPAGAQHAEVPGAGQHEDERGGERDQRGEQAAAQARGRVTDGRDRLHHRPGGDLAQRRPTASARISGMITKPPPNDSAPTLNATQATPASTPPPAAAAPSAGSITTPLTFPAAAPGPSCPATSPCGRRSASSASPQPSRTSTSHGPMVAAAAPPATRYAAQRTWRGRPALHARVQLGLSRVQPAWTATAATAAPAPAPAPFTHSGGVPARNSADSARMQASPGRMK